MSRIKWVGDIEKRRKQLRNSGNSYQQVANILTDEFGIRITRDMVSSRDRAVRTRGYDSYIEVENDDDINVKLPIEQDTETEQESYEHLFPVELYNLKEEYISSEETKKELKEIWEMFEDNKPKKILSLSDLHSPYMDFKKIEKAITDNSDCTICILNGDIFDGESMSTFDKMDEIDSSAEFGQVFELLDVLTTRFEHIIWVGGNHDFQRFYRYICKNIKPGLRKFAFDRLNPMKYISDKYKNVITINHNTIQIGDTIFKHPNGYSSVEMKTIVNELDVINANRHDFPNPNFRGIIIGHTHDGGDFIKNGVKLIEQGCLCYTPDYRFTNPVKRKWTTGYARIELDENNKMIFNKSSFICLE